MAIDPATLKLRYPAFAAVPDATIEYWLTDAAREIDERYGEDQEVATLAYAAHSMAATPGVLPSATGITLTSGLTSFKSGSASMTFSDTAVSIVSRGGYGSTAYGREFLRYQQRHLGGPRLVGFVC